MNTLLITFSGYQDHETIYPYYRTGEEGEVHVMSDVANGRVYGILGAHIDSKYHVNELHYKESFDKLMNHYDLLVIPGGLKAIEKLRQEKQVLDFIAEWDKRKKLIAVTCNGCYMLISAKITKGRTLSGYYAAEIDITNSQATYVNAPVVVDDNIVSSPHYKNMSEWMKKVVEVWKEKNELH